MIDSFVEELDRLGATGVLGVVLEQYSVPEPATLDPAQSDALVELCLNHRIGAILLEAVVQQRVVLAESAVLRLREGVGFLLSTQLRVERGALAMIELLAAEGIEFRVLKGLATAYLDYPNPAFRGFGDVDLLVRPRDVPRMMRMLEASGRGHFYVIRGNDWRIQHAVTFVIDGIEVDLHHRLLHQAAGHRVAKLDLFADPEWFEIAGRRVAALPAWLRHLQASAQNQLSAPEGRKLTSDLDAKRLERRNGGRGGPQAHVTTTTEEKTRSGLISAASPVVVGQGQIVSRTFEELVVAGPRAWWRTIRSVLFPGREFRSTRDRSYLGHLRHLSGLIGRSMAEKVRRRGR